MLAFFYDPGLFVSGYCKGYRRLKASKSPRVDLSISQIQSGNVRIILSMSTNYIFCSNRNDDGEVLSTQAEMAIILITGWCEWEDGWSSLEKECLGWHPLCFAVASVSSCPPPHLSFFFFFFFPHYTFCVKITFLSLMKSLPTLKTGRERLSYNGFNMRKP